MSRCPQAIAEAGSTAMTDTPIELQITAITVDEYADAATAVAHAVRFPHRLRQSLAGTFVVWTMVAVFAKSWWLAVGGGLFAVLAINLPLSLFGGVKHFRQNAPQRMRDTPELYGPQTLTLAENGVHTRTATTEALVEWSTYERYAETTQSFVLFGPNRPGAARQILPKRALASPAEIERLRALLDHHLQRVTP